jgi:putative transposase
MVPGTFIQMYVHLVFAVRKRDNVLTSEIRPRIFEYIGGILLGLRNKPIIINGCSDHIHIQFGLNPAIALFDTVHDIKRSSSIFINENRLVQGRFSWQERNGAFTCSKKELNNVVHYIENQEYHHSENHFWMNISIFLKRMVLIMIQSFCSVFLIKDKQY